MVWGRLVRQDPRVEVLKAKLMDPTLQLLHWFGTSEPCTAAIIHPVDWAQVQEARCRDVGRGEEEEDVL